MPWAECLTNETKNMKSTPPLCQAVQESAEKFKPGLVSYEVRQIVEVVAFAIVIAAIGVFGMASNIINIVIFYKHGFHDTVNISLFALALSDFFTILTLEWISLCLNPLFYNSGIPWDTKQVLYLSGSWPHFCFGRVSCWVTTYITAERCLCIALPMTVKQIVTPRRTTFVMCLTYVANFLIAVPIYMASYFDWTYIPKRNITLIAIVYRENGEVLDNMGYVLFAAAGMIPFPPVIIFTIILVVRLKHQSNWRMKSSHDSKQQEVTTKRDSKTMNMLVMVACILIVCYTPGRATSVAMFFTADFTLTGRYANLFFVAWCLVSVFQVVNASINIFVYYNMSSKYKKTFRTMVLRLADSQND